MCRKPRSLSSNMLNVLASRNCLNCAGGLVVAKLNRRALLLYKSPLSETAKARIEIMRETEDGFRIAEEDLRLRGGGDAIGTQHPACPASDWRKWTFTRTC